jgi:ECF sigma factor
LYNFSGSMAGQSAGVVGQVRIMTTDETDSVTRDLQDLRAGSQSATARIVRRYWGRLQGLVRPRLRWYGRPAISVDEEDVAHAALHSVVKRLKLGKYPGIVDQDGLWRMLAKYAVRKAARVVKKWKGHPTAQPFSTMNSRAASSRSPSSRVATIDERDRLIDAIKAYQPPRSAQPSSEKLIQLAHLLSEGHDIPEIAQRLEVGRCTIYRWIDLVGKIGEKRGIARQNSESAP